MGWKTQQIGVRPFFFFAHEEDLPHGSPDAPLPEAIAKGKRPLLMNGGDGRG